MIAYGVSQTYGKIEVVTNASDYLYDLYKANEQYIPEYYILCK